MRVEYEEDCDTHREVIAFIHRSGALIVRNNCPSEDDKYCMVVVPLGVTDGDASSSFDTEHWWNIWLDSAVKKFYVGDTITVTF